MATRKLVMLVATMAILVGAATVGYFQNVLDDTVIQDLLAVFLGLAVGFTVGLLVYGAERRARG